VAQVAVVVNHLNRGDGVVKDEVLGRQSKLFAHLEPFKQVISRHLR